MGENDLVNSPICVLGIDPGMSGAVFKIGRGKFEGWRDFKTKQKIAEAIFCACLAKDVDLAVMELVHAMPGQGVCSMFSFGRAAGVADGALCLALPGKPVEEVTPQKWQNYFRALLAIPKGETFDSCRVAAKIFPSFAPQFLLRKKDHNSADAILIAAWRLMQN